MKSAEPQIGETEEPSDCGAAQADAARESLRVLILDEDADVFDDVVAALGDVSTAVCARRVGGVHDFVAALEDSPELIVACFHQRGCNAKQAVDLLNELGIDTPLIVMMNGSQGIAEGDNLLLRGAADLVTRERVWRLRFCVPRALERKRLIDQARSDNARYRLTFDTVPVGVITSRDSGQLVSVNSTALRILGFEDEASFVAATEHDNWARCASAQDKLAYASRMVSSGSVHDFETTLRRSDDGIVPVAISGRAIVDPAQDGWLIITIIEDLSARKHAESALLHSEQRLSGMVESAMDGILMVDEHLRIVLINPAAQRMFGGDRAEMLGESLQKFIPAVFTGMLSNGRKTGVLAVLARRRDDSSFPVEVSISALQTAQGQLYTAFLRDVTERSQQENRIARLSRIQAMFSSINSAIVRIRARGELLQEACRIAVELGSMTSSMITLLDEQGTHAVATAAFGPDVDVLLGKRYALNLEDPPPHDLLAYAMRNNRSALDNDLVAHAHLQGNRAESIARGYRSIIALPLMVNDRAVGGFILASSEPEFFTGEEVSILEQVAADVSFALESIDKAERVNHLAFYDALTDLPNRNLFLERLAQTLRRGRASNAVVPLMKINIERFRFVNETLGRAAGDELLLQVTQRLQGLLRGDFASHVQEVARVAGDVFAIALSSIRDADQATLAVKEVLRRVFAQPFNVHGSELRVRARCGVSLFPSDGSDPDQLARNAQAAMANAKRSAEAFLFYAPEMNAHAADVLALENKLRRAIELEQFVLHYQPKVSLIDRSITGVEALIRWEDPETGLVPPGRFIPILEETGMIFEVGRWAMQQAIRDYKSWVTRGLFAPRIAVNISPLQLRHGEFLADLRRTLEEHAEAIVGLDFEITESMIMEDLDHNIAILEQIREFGINVAIDDFGTGYSSLSYLAKLPLSQLKIDRSFIISMTQTPQGFAIVSTIIALAHALNLRVVAEGVETEEQAKFLRVLNCDEIQGYLISKPLPLGKLETLLAGNVTLLPPSSRLRA